MRLKNISLAISDNISIKGVKTTANSKMLQNYIPPFNATVVERLLKEDPRKLEKGSIKEFGVGESEEHWGTAKVVAQGKKVIGVASDIGGEIVKSANHYGIYGLKPSYGLVSRYGLIGVSSSIDTIGILGNSIKDISLVLGIIGDKDPKDSTSIGKGNIEYNKSLNIDKDDIRGLKIGVLGKDFRENISNFLEGLRKLDVNVEGISLPLLEYAPQVHEIISSGEFASNMARFDGISYGYRTENYENVDELYKNSRSESLGEDVKKKILFGNFVLSSENYKEYYEKSQRIRTLIKEEFNNIFKEYDFLLSPISSTFTKGVNLAGLPALSLPCNDKGADKGIQLIGPAFEEEKLLSLGYIYEDIILKQDKIGGEK